jgi:hypothetical protein
MEDAFKFAFEILVVGVLALPWVAILSIMFLGKPSDGSAFYMSIVPKPAQSAVALSVVIAMAYLLGSAVSRLSRNFFDEGDMFPTEHSIRRAVYAEEYCNHHVVKYMSLPHLQSQLLTSGQQWFCTTQPKDDMPVITEKPLITEKPTREEQFDTDVGILFRLQESSLLLNGHDKTDRLRQYFDQITVLRGAAFNFFVLFSLCIFGAAGNLRGQLASKSGLRIWTLSPPIVVIAYGFLSLLHHVSVRQGSLYRHPPLVEFCLLLLGVTGFFAVLRARHAALYPRVCVIAAFLCVASFCGWWWTEVMYDMQVIYSRPTGWFIDAERQPDAK